MATRRLGLTVARATQCSRCSASHFVDIGRCTSTVVVRTTTKEVQNGHSALNDRKNICASLKALSSPDDHSNRGIPITSKACTSTRAYSTSVETQDVKERLIGTWAGVIEANGMEYPLKFSINLPDGAEELVCVLDPAVEGAVMTNSSPDLPEHAVSSDEISFVFKNVGAFRGFFAGDIATIEGKWTQMHVDYDVTLRRTTEVPGGNENRPQHPTMPLPYDVLELTIPSVEGVELSASLSLPPEGVEHLATVILLAGSGPQTRDQAVAGHLTHLVLSDYLVRHGVGTLRFDKRGVSKSTGDYPNATVEDFAIDAEYVCRFLQLHDSSCDKPIGLIGHSEGGLIAPLVANKLNDEGKGVDSVVLMASMAMPGLELQMRQQKLVGKAEGSPEDLLELMNTHFNKRIFKVAMGYKGLAMKNSTDSADIDAEYTRCVREMKHIANDFVQNHVPEKHKQLFPSGEVLLPAGINTLTPWFRHFFSYDPVPAIQRLALGKTRVCAINGERDTQVPPENLRITEDILQNARKNDGSYMCKIYPARNHLFQGCHTGGVSEYAAIHESFGEEVMADIVSFVTNSPSMPASRP